MPYWIELHCAIKQGQCHSNIQHEVAMTMSFNASMLAINQAIFRINKEAKEKGWLQRDVDWICPECMKSNLSLV